MPRRQDPESSVAIGGEKKKRGPLWLLLALLALLIIAAIIIGLVSCGDDDDDAASKPTPPATTASTPPAASTPTDPAGGAEAGREASLTVGADSLLAADAPSISDQVGQTARGVQLRVLSVTDSGFFVGTDESDRQYVEYGDEVGKDEKLGEKPAVDDVVGLTGEIRPAPEDPAQTLKLDEANAETVTERGAYVNATSVVPGS